MSTPDELKQILDELKSNLRSDHSDLPSFDVERHCRSRQLLAMIDELDRLIAAETKDKASRRKQLQARSRTAQHFAEHLDADPSRFPSAYYTAEDGRNVWVVLKITGTPSRAGRQQADEWTASRNQLWNGDIEKLRATIRQALRDGAKLPAGHFGLRIERTIRIGHWSNDDAREWENVQSPLGPDDIRF
jgi:hypothetical protein